MSIPSVWKLKFSTTRVNGSQPIVIVDPNYAFEGVVVIASTCPTSLSPLQVSARPFKIFPRVGEAVNDLVFVRVLCGTDIEYGMIHITMDGKKKIHAQHDPVSIGEHAFLGINFQVCQTGVEVVSDNICFSSDPQAPRASGNLRLRRAYPEDILSFIAGTITREEMLKRAIVPLRNLEKREQDEVLLLKRMIDTVGTPVPEARCLTTKKEKVLITGPATASATPQKEATGVHVAHTRRLQHLFPAFDFAICEKTNIDNSAIGKTVLLTIISQTANSFYLWSPRSGAKAATVLSDGTIHGSPSLVRITEFNRARMPAADVSAAWHHDARLVVYDTCIGIAAKRMVLEVREEALNKDSTNRDVEEFLKAAAMLEGADAHVELSDPSNAVTPA